MLFRPATLALLLAAAANAIAVLAVAPFAFTVVREWDLSSRRARQLALERRTYLVSTLLGLVLAAQLGSLLLFVYNADRMAPLFVGAMCAVGSFNANGYGFPALLTQVTVFFLAFVWLAINHLDTLAPDYPLVRTKYALLLGLAPLLAVNFYMQLRYFLLLRADIVTSCCARIFADGVSGLGAELQSAPPGPAVAFFFCAVLLATGLAGMGRWGYLTAGASLLAFAGSLVGMISFLSLYVYEHPHHHCPFCVLKAEYHFVGYLFYVPLFAATACGLAAGAVRAFASTPSLRQHAQRVMARLSLASCIGFAAVAIFAAAAIWNSKLILFDTTKGLLP
jgi:hypothetical protein